MSNYISIRIIRNVKPGNLANSTKLLIVEWEIDLVTENLQVKENLKIHPAELVPWEGGSCPSIRNQITRTSRIPNYWWEWRFRRTAAWWTPRCQCPWKSRQAGRRGKPWDAIDGLGERIAEGEKGRKWWGVCGKKWSGRIQIIWERKVRWRGGGWAPATPLAVPPYFECQQ